MMDQDVTLTQNVETLFNNLENFTQNEGVLGKPVSYGDKTFIPVVTVTMGYGAGNTNSDSNPTNVTTASTGSSTKSKTMGGGALGLGAKLSADAVIIIDKDNVSLVPMTAAGATTQLMDKIPQMISGMGKGQQGQQNQSQNQQSTSGTANTGSTNSSTGSTWQGTSSQS